MEFVPVYFDGLNCYNYLRGCRPLDEHSFTSGCHIFPMLMLRMGRDSSVGIATRYELDGPVIESRRGEIFRTRPDRP